MTVFREFTCKRRYGLALDIWHRLRFSIPEQIKASVGFIAGVLTHGEFCAGARYCFSTYFWNIHYFDGTWYFDGSKMFEGRTYGMLVGIDHRFMLECQQDIKVCALHTKWGQHIMEDADAGLLSRFAADFWQKQYEMLFRMYHRFMLEGSPEEVKLYALDIGLEYHIKERLDVGLSSHFEAEIDPVLPKAGLDMRMELDESGLGTAERGLVIETKTSDYWYLDGSIQFNGTRRFNSIYIREVRQ